MTLKEPFGAVTSVTEVLNLKCYRCPDPTSHLSRAPGVPGLPGSRKRSLLSSGLFLLMSSSVAPLLASEIPTLEGAIVPHWIGGKTIARTGDPIAPLYNPATGQVARFFPFSSQEEFDAAVSAANTQFPPSSSV